MRQALLLFVSLAIVASSIPIRGAEGVKIKIDKIMKDDQITGSVAGLTDAGRGGHVVYVFVKTNAWYIHPFERGGEGKSFATVAANGAWAIGTVYRGFPASAIAAVVVKRGITLPSQLISIRDVPSEAIVVRELEGTSDYGKV